MILTPHFFYLCYSLKLTARGEWLGYISEGWRGFSQGFDQKLEAIWSQRFFGAHLRTLERFFCRGLTKSRRLFGATLFRVIAASYLGSLAIGVERQPEADGRKHFSGLYLRALAELFAGD